MRHLPLLTLLLAADAVAGPSLVWSQQGQADAAATFYRLDPGGPARAVATVPTMVEYEPWSAIAPDGTAIAAVSLVKSLDRARGATLFRIALPSGETRPLATGCAYQRPLALPGGRIAFVKVSSVDPAPPERSSLGELDTLNAELWLAESDGSTRRLAGDAAYALVPVAATANAVFVYRVARDEGALYRVPLAGSGWTRVAALPGPGFARDFSVRGDELVFASVTPEARWTLFSVGLTSGKVRALTALPSDHATPLVAGPNVLFLSPSSAGAERLVAFDGKTAKPLLDGPGWPIPLAASRDGALLAIQRQHADRQELWLHQAGKKSERIETARYFTVAGFAEVAP